MNTFAAIDLSLLPAPQIVQQIDYEQILAERKAYAVSLWPPEEQAEIAARLNLESEPLTKLLEENAYRETLWRQRVNESALAVLLPYAKGADLEQIGARFGVERLTIIPANPSAVPRQPRSGPSARGVAHRNSQPQAAASKMPIHIDEVQNVNENDYQFYIQITARPMRK